MEGSEILQLLAELSIGVLGFSGVVAVLGRRSAGDWSAFDRSFGAYLGTLLLGFGSPIILFIRLLYSAMGPSRSGGCSRFRFSSP